MFETECERQYNEKLAKAKLQIDNDDYLYYGTICPQVYGYLDGNFSSYEANQMVRTWNAKLNNAVELYKSWHENEEAEREAEKEQLRLQKKRLKEEQEARNASLRQQYEEEERRKNAERARQREVRRKSSLKTLTSIPYSLSEEEASRFINDEGEIEELEFTKYKNAQRNRNLVAKKAAEWEAMKGNQQNGTSSSAIICPSCGNSSKNTDKFCRACGTAIQKVCPSCKKLLPINNKFCTACGTKL